MRVVEPRAQAGKGQGQRLPAPREAGETVRATRPPTEDGTPSTTGGGSILAKGPLPTRAASRPPRDPPDSPSPGYRWPAAPTSSAATTTISSTAADPRRPPAPMAAGARGAEISEREALAGGVHAPKRPPQRRWGSRVLLFHAGRPRSAACAREGSRNGPGRGARPPPLRIRQCGGVETVPTPGPRGPGPRPNDLRAQSPALCPPDSRLLAPSALELRSSDARTNGRADRRAGTWAGGWRAGGGSQGCSARKQRGPSAGPRSGRGKRRRGSGLGRDSAPDRGPRGVEGGRAGGRRRPARPPASLPILGPAPEAPVAP